MKLTANLRVQERAPRIDAFCRKTRGELRRWPSQGGRLKIKSKRKTRGRMVKGLLISGNRAMQLFGGSEKVAIAYAKMLNQGAARIPEHIKVYSLIAPTAISFYAPQAYRNNANKERQYLGHIGHSLTERIQHIPLYEVLDSHRDEYLYFRTDHHWTARSAYWAYVAFCKTAGFGPAPLSEFTRPVPFSFYGSLFGATRAKELRRGRDKLEIFVPSRTYSAKRLRKKARRFDVNVRFVYPKRKSYSAFLGSDHPIMIAETDHTNDHGVLLVKNSYGNPIAPFLLHSFKRVVVVDYRHFEGDLGKVVRDYRVGHIILQNSSLTSGSRFHRRRMKRLLRMARFE